MIAHFYSRTPAGSEQSIALEDICGKPGIGDRVKLNDVWWQVVDVQERQRFDHPDVPLGGVSIEVR